MARARKSAPPPPMRDDSPFYVITGSERYLRVESLADMVEKWRRESGDDGISTFTGAEAELATVLDEVRTPGLLAPRRLVVVREADTFVTAHRAALERFAESPSDCGVLVLECGSCPSNTRLYKRVAELGGIVVCDTLDRGPMITWLMERATKKHQKTLDRQAAALLVELGGEEMGQLDSELAKLATYCGDRKEMTEADVLEIVDVHRVEMIFGVTDAIGRRDPAAALENWHKVVTSDKDAPFRAVGGLAWSIRRLIDIKRDVVRGESFFSAAKRRGVYRNADEIEAQIRNYSCDALENMLRELLTIDVGSKSGGPSVAGALERYIVSSCLSR